MIWFSQLMQKYPGKTVFNLWKKVYSWPSVLKDRLQQLKEQVKRKYNCNELCKSCGCNILCFLFYVSRLEHIIWQFTFGLSGIFYFRVLGKFRMHSFFVSIVNLYYHALNKTCTYNLMVNCIRRSILYIFINECFKFL